MKNKFLITILLFLQFLVACKDTTNRKVGSQEISVSDDKYEQQRNDMVETQIYQRGVRDELVLKAMRKVPRHEYVPPNLHDYAYQDHPLPIGENQTISQPYIVAFMTECLGLKGGEKVLEIGTGSGYQAAILGEIAGEVYTIEIIESLAHRAKEILEKMDYKNIYVKWGDGYQGWPEKAPFDGIIVTAAPDHIPQPLIDQLKPGGRMIIPVGDYYQELILIAKSNEGEISQRSVLPVRFVPMTGKAQTKN